MKHRIPRMYSMVRFITGMAKKMNRIMEHPKNKLTLFKEQLFIKPKTRLRCPGPCRRLWWFCCRCAAPNLRWPSLSPTSRLTILFKSHFLIGVLNLVARTVSCSIITWCRSTRCHRDATNSSSALCPSSSDCDSPISSICHHRVRSTARTLARKR